MPGGKNTGRVYLMPALHRLAVGESRKRPVSWAQRKKGCRVFESPRSSMCKGRENP